jgi:signal transduction histidine kinase
MTTIVNKRVLPRRSFETAITAAFIGALLVMGLVTSLSLYLVTRFLTSTGWVNHTHVVLVTLERANSSIAEVLAATEEFLVTADPATIVERDRAISALQASLGALGDLTVDNQAEQRRLANLRARAAEYITYMTALVATRQAAGLEASRERLTVDQPRRLVNRLREPLNEMRDSEHLLLQHRLFSDQTSQRRLIAACGALLAVVILTVGLGFLRLRRELHWRQALAEDLERKTSELQTSNKELESFSYSVSHDLRSPLRAIDSFALMLEEDYAAKIDDQGRRYIRVVREGAQNMGRLIDDLLSFSRLGREPINAVGIDLRVGAERAMREVLMAHAGPPPRLLMHKLPAGYGDAALLHHVWTNLIANAVKYSSKIAEPCIEIGGCIEGSEAVYFVKDNGAGFDMRYVDKLFRVFQRLHAADEFPGSGVGLAIVQRVISRHGGRVWGEGEPERGAKFFFTLPQAALT